ncbi:hypothetical protein LCGC14_1181180 [marine sediment metagenome]|uniref:Fibronectin type-III domain-containing protein n=1 Tax=marine sediment metagenome TaxID=412755 RepID=A0A0F9P501_9ZZZZ
MPTASLTVTELTPDITKAAGGGGRRSSTPTEEAPTITKAAGGGGRRSLDILEFLEGYDAGGGGRRSIILTEGYPDQPPGPVPEAALLVLPTVTTDPATGLGAVSASLNGTLDDDGTEACDCGFEWGLDTGYGTTTPTQSKTTGETFSQVTGGLQPGTTYHFRALATNSAGTSHGADRSFTTDLVISRGYALGREGL